MDISVLDIVLLNLTSYLLGVGSGLLFCCKYKDRITRSGSMDNLSKYKDSSAIICPQETHAPVVAASAPAPLKLTIQ